MVFFIVLVIVLYFIFRNMSVKVSGFSGQSAFTYDQIDVRILALSSAVIKADGVVNPAEINFVRQQFIAQFGQARAERAFANFKTFEGKNSVEHICRELMFSMSYVSRQSVLAFLFQVAASDGTISDNEVRAIAQMAGWMGIAQQHFYHIYSAFAQGAYQGYGSTGRPTGASSGRSAYEVLDVAETATVEEIKQSYRILAKKYHPDRLVKYPPEEQKIAKDKFIEIQDAYERIKRERGF